MWYAVVLSVCLMLSLSVCVFDRQMEDDKEAALQPGTTASTMPVLNVQSRAQKYFDLLIRSNVESPSQYEAS